MDSARITRAQVIFDELADLPAAERAVRLTDRCGRDDALRHLVDQLFVSHDQGLSRFLQSPMIDLAGSSEEVTSASIRPAETRPARLGVYRVIRELERGGMGIVYLAVREDDQFRKTVAIKILKRGMDTEDILSRFELERQVLSALNHPNIARLHDAGATDDGRPFFVLEYIEGEPIDEYCDSHRLRTVERLEIFKTVCRAVHYAHQNLIVHRDLKPGNILVTKDGVPKLLDFGIAKILNPDLAAVARDPTATELRPMTPQYASPEQVQGKPITTATDVYSLGAILYELLTGHRPYRLATSLQSEIVDVVCNLDPEKPSSAVTKVEQIDSEQAAQGSGTTTFTITPESVSRVRDSRVSTLRRQLRGDLDNIVMKAVRKAPQRRYLSAEKLADDIDNHLGGLPIKARPDSVTYRTRKFVWRHRVGVAVAAVIAVAGLSSLTLAWQGARDRATLLKQARELDQAEGAKQLSLSEAARANERAEAAGKLADQLRSTLRETAKVFLEDLDDKLRPLPGAGMEARELVVTQTLPYLRRLAEQNAEDDGLQRELAEGLDRASRIYWNLRGGHLGDQAMALEQLEEARGIRERLHRQTPEDEDLSVELAKTLVGLGDLHRAMHRANEALDEYRMAADLYDRAIQSAEQPSLRLLRGRADSLSNQADMLVQGSGDDQRRALELYEQSLRRRKENLARFPDDRSTRRDLAVGHHKLGLGHEATPDHREALEHHEIGLELRIALAEGGSAELAGMLERDLAISWLHVARCIVELRDRSRLEEAVDLLRDSQSVLVTLAEADAAALDRRLQRDLALTDEWLGRAHVLAFDPERALRRFEQFQERSQQLVQHDRSSKSYRRMLGTSYELMAGPLLEAGDGPHARDALDSALSIFERLASEPDARGDRERVESIRLKLVRVAQLVEDY